MVGLYVELAGLGLEAGSGFDIYEGEHTRKRKVLLATAKRVQGFVSCTGLNEIHQAAPTIIVSTRCSMEGLLGRNIISTNNTGDARENVGEFVLHGEEPWLVNHRPFG